MLRAARDRAVRILHVVRARLAAVLGMVARWVRARAASVGHLVRTVARSHALTWWAGAAIAVLAVGGLGAGALHGVRQGGTLTSATAQREALASNGYYDCLTAEALQLVRPGDVIYLGSANLQNWTTVSKVMGGWADLTLRPSHANVALLVLPVPKGRSCGGQKLVIARKLPGGHLVFASGHPTPPRR